jgi:CPA2 family monovalent cation:H+ antiporter-2
MEIPLLGTIIVVFSLSIAVVFVCGQIRIPPIIGFLLTGAIAGPHGLGLVNAVREVDMLATVGVVLLVFTTGMEFSFRELLQLKKQALLGGFLQVFLTVLAVFLLARLCGQPAGISLFLGLLTCHTSTAIMLKLLQARDESGSPHGRTCLAVSLFQDIGSVPMMIVTPMLAGTALAAGDFAREILVLSAKGIGIVAVVFVLAVWVVPWLLYRILRTRIYELFLLCVVAICFAVAWLTSRAELSLALGAFFAGLIISESEYSNQAISNIVPFRDVFTSFFFVSIGMLLDVRFVLQNPTAILGLACGILAIKAVIAGGVVLLLGYPLRTAVFSGILLCQVGEFSFILAQASEPYRLLSPELYQTLLAVVVVTMISSPFLLALAPPLLDFLLRVPMPKKIRERQEREREKPGEELKDHLLIIGFGINGRNLAQAAKLYGIQHMIVEMNAETVKRERDKGEPIYYGDATQERVLRHFGMDSVRILVIAISDPLATKRIVSVARRMNPKVHIIVRIRYLQEMQSIYSMGANEVIPEEFETSVEIFTRVLRKYLVPKEDIEKFAEKVRTSKYQMLRSVSRETSFLTNLRMNLSDIEVSGVRMDENSPLAGKTLAESDVRRAHSVTVVAVRHGWETMSNPDGATRLLGGDILLCLGAPEKIASFTKVAQNRVQPVVTTLSGESEP